MGFPESAEAHGEDSQSKPTTQGHQAQLLRMVGHHLKNAASAEPESAQQGSVPLKKTLSEPKRRPSSTKRTKTEPVSSARAQVQHEYKGPWEQHLSPDGIPYYYNSATKVVASSSLKQGRQCSRRLLSSVFPSLALLYSPFSLVDTKHTMTCSAKHCRTPQVSTWRRPEELPGAPSAGPRTSMAEPSWFACTICTKGFKSERQLRQHKAVAHRGHKSAEKMAGSMSDSNDDEPSPEAMQQIIASFKYVY